MDQRRRRTGGRATPGILTLARVIHHHGHAVQRDILALGFRKSDMFTTLTVDDMIAIVVAAQPGTAIYHAVNGGYTTTDHLLATQLEYQAGLVGLPTRIARAGVTDLRPTKLPNIHDSGKMMFDSMTIEEYEARRARRVKGA